MRDLIAAIALSVVLFAVANGNPRPIRAPTRVASRGEAATTTSPGPLAATAMLLGETATRGQVACTGVAGLAPDRARDY